MTAESIHAARFCETCGRELIKTANLRANHYRIMKYCSPDCRSKAKYAPSRMDHLSSGSIGAWGELVASADLMKRGYEVFRALSPSCTCDIVACKGGKALRVEVRTGGRLSTGKIKYGFYHHDTPGKADVFAVVEQSGDVVYLYPGTQDAYPI